MPTRRAAVLGSPIAHSRSPLLHRAAYAAMGLDWTYDAIEITTEGLAAFLADCTWPEWAGLSLTMPLKSEVLPLLDSVSDTATTVRAANTVVFTEEGRQGHNTDVEGMRRALEVAHGSALTVGDGIVIGSGATARSAMAALAGLGARDVTVIARRREKAMALHDLAEALEVNLTCVDWTPDAGLDADAVIATVPPGAADEFALRVPANPGVLLDVAYGDGVTDLARAWSIAGGPVADGLDLLLRQAVEQVRLMTGAEPPVEAMEAALQSERGSST